MNPSSTSKPASARILLVDDNRQGLAARKVVLEELGYEVVTAGSGAEGMKRFSEGGVELIVTDFKMPRMNGVELIEAVRLESACVPIILLTGFADALGLDEKNTGADIVIQKSANEVTHMVRAVRKLLRVKAPKKPPGSHSNLGGQGRRRSG